MRLLIALTCLAFVNAYAGHGIIGRWPAALEDPWLAFSVCVFIFALQLAGPFGDRLGFARWRQRSGIGPLVAAIDWLSYLTLGAVSCLLIYVFVADWISFGWKLLASPADPARFDHDVLLILVAVTVATLIIGMVQVLAGPKVRCVDIALKNLPQNFTGFTIAQVSDLHLGSTIGRGYAENVVRIVNGLKPDLIALTGDFADGTVEDLSSAISCLADLSAPYGRFYVTGNHEYYWGAAAWMREFTRLGARVLANEHAVIDKDGQQIIIAGVTDYSSRHLPPGQASDPRAALSGAPLHRVKILLAHQPISHQEAEAAGFDLQLSGHTHGGQYFPFSLLIRFFQRFYKGLNRHENLQIYVNRGTGYWGPPLRTFVQAEITLLTLRRAA